MKGTETNISPTYGVNQTKERDFYVKCKLQSSIINFHYLYQNQKFKNLDFHKSEIPTTQIL